MNFNNAYLLTLTWVIPFLAVFMILPVKKENHRLIKWISLSAAAVNLLLVIWIAIKFSASAQISGTGVGGKATILHFAQKIPWFQMMNIYYNIGIDGISLLLMLLTASVIFCGVLASWGVEESPKEFFALLNVLVGGVFGVFISFDLFTLFLFYEVAVLPMYLLIGLWGTGRKEYSAMKLTLMLVAGSAFIFAGILALYFQSGIHSFDILELSKIHFSSSFQHWAFPILFLGFGVLGALFPFHTWSPDGHASAPTAVSMLHAGVLMKLGGYGCLRIAMYLLPEGCREWMDVILVLTTLNVVYGAFGAVKQTDLKYVTAYSSVSHCGLVLFAFTALNFVAVKGAILQMVSHGLVTALLFCLIGMIYGRTHTRTMSEMGGLTKVIPFLSAAFTIAGLCKLGLPGLSGFVAEATVFIGSFGNLSHFHRICTGLVVLSIVVTAVYVLRAVNTMLNGPLNEHFADIKDATFVEKVPVAILVALLFAMGIFPSWMIRIIDGAIDPILNQIYR